MLAWPKALAYLLLVVMLAGYLMPKAAQAQELGPIPLAGRLCSVLEYSGDGDEHVHFQCQPIDPARLQINGQGRSPRCRRGIVRMVDHGHCRVHGRAL